MIEQLFIEDEIFDLIIYTIHELLIKSNAITSKTFPAFKKGQVLTFFYLITKKL